MKTGSSSAASSTASGAGEAQRPILGVEGLVLAGFAAIFAFL